MKFSSESFKSKSENNLKSIDFKMKNEFFYNNAYTIIKSNQLFNEKTYLDVLETINSKYEDESEKKIKFQSDQQKDKNPVKSEEEKIKTQTETLKIRKKNFKEKFKSENFSKNSTAMNDIKNYIKTQGEKDNENEKTLKLKKLKIKSENEQLSKNFSNFKNSNIQSTIPNLKKFLSTNSSENERNLKTFSSTIEKNFNSTTSSPGKRKLNLLNYSTQSPQNFSKNSSSKNFHHTTKNFENPSKKYSLTSPGKYFLDELNQIKEKYIYKFQEKYFSNNSNSTLKNRLNEFQEFEEKSTENKNEKKSQLNTKTKTIFRNFIFDIFGKYLKEKKLEENTEPDPISIKLRILDNLEHSIPEHSKLITKLKRALTNMEKRKVIVNYNNLELGEKLDDLISLNKSKLNWDFYRIHKNCLPVEFQRKIFRNENLLENLGKNYKKHSKLQNDLLFPQSNGEVIKTKFKSVGKAKILIVPSQIKKDKEIYEDQKLFQFKEIRNELKEVLSPQTTNLKIKKFLDELAVPKNKTSSQSKRDIPKEKILDDYKKFEKINLTIVNKIKRIKKKFNNKSMYVDPKSAFYEIK